MVALSPGYVLFPDLDRNSPYNVVTQGLAKLIP